jgi:hypothetical protein
MNCAAHFDNPFRCLRRHFSDRHISYSDRIGFARSHACYSRLLEFAEGIANLISRSPLADPLPALYTKFQSESIVKIMALRIVPYLFIPP